jgi:TatD DNase family protein
MSCFFDTHCHLADANFSSDFLSQCLASQSRPSSAQKHYYLAVSTSPEDWLKTVELGRQYPHVFPAIGLHPWFVQDGYLQQLSALDDFLSAHRDAIFAIGEIGLDKGAGRPSMVWQEVVFEHQIQLAERYDLPVSIHCTKAFNPMLTRLRDSNVAGVMHGFTGGAVMAKQFVEAGMLIGVNSVLLNENARRYHELVQTIGLDALVLESDAPFGQNLPVSNPLAGLGALSVKIAALLQVSEETVLERSCENAKRLFLKGRDGSII